MNKVFLEAHPSMIQFVDGIKDLCNQAVNDIDMIESGISVPGKRRREVTTYAIPDDYQ